MSIGQGALRMTFSHPALARRFKTSRPRLTVDGIEQRLDGWGAQIVTVPAGPHRLRVGVVPQRGGAEEGAAEVAVTVDLGAQLHVEYRAPWSRGSSGKLRVLSAKAFGE